MGASVKALLVALVAKHCLSQCVLLRFTPRFYSANNRALERHVFQRETASSAVVCGRDCSMHPKCASFNYDATGHMCELSYQTRSESQLDFIHKQGSTYFDSYNATASLSTPDAKEYVNCQTFFRDGNHNNGIYTIYPPGVAGGLQVYCDMETDGGGWIVLQRRQDGSVDFYRTWTDYQSGFGDLSGEFWLGNEALRNLTETGQWQLRVDLGDWEGNAAWAKYELQ